MVNDRYHDPEYGAWDDAPALTSWQFDNCTLYANYASKVIHNPIRDQHLNYTIYDLCQVDVKAAINEYLEASFPRAEDHSTLLARYLMLDWYKAHCFTLALFGSGTNVTNNLSREIIGKMFTWTDPLNHTFLSESVSHQCTKELRNKLQIEGNSDIVGIGVLISYFIEAGLATAFVAVMAFGRFYPSPHPSNAGSKIRYRSVRDSFEASLSVFFWASVLLCLGMQLASLMTIFTEFKEEDMIKRIQKWEHGEKFYINTSYFAALASGFCSASVFIPGQLLLQGNRRRRRLIIAILVGVGALQTITLAYFLKADSKSRQFFSNFDNTMARRLLMLDTRYQTFWSSTTVILFSLVDFVGVVILIVAALHIVKKDQRERKFPGLLKKVIDMILQAAWLTMMWTTLAFIMNERGELEEIDGSENPLNDWSFGQILAFSTWVPVFVEFFYTYLYGIREGLTGNMPSKYKAVPKDDQVRSPERDIEMNIHDESSSEAWRAGTSIPSANTARAGGMNSSTGLATGTERLIAEPTRRVNKTSLKPTRTW